MARLSPQDEEFFDLVARATFCNPFSDERVELDLKIARCPPSLTVDERVERVSHKIRERVGKLEERGLADLRRYGGEALERMRSAFLFEIFHRFLEQLDELLMVQMRAGDAPCPVPFAREALGLLRRRGFAAEESLRFFAMFYQARRAFYFVDRALVGQSPSMKQLRLRLWNNVFTHDIRWYEKYLWDRMEDFSTLILGETGTGKGTAAAAIGRSGFIPFDPARGVFAESFMRTFITINLSLYPESLIESELFGHRKGAFTGAIEHHQGAFARCSPHGSVFLDEIGDVSLPVQVKLLQVLQERTFSPVGSHERHRFHGRVIAATNRNLEELRGKGLFRDDFYYRLCSDIIVAPPLRRRLRENPRELETMLRHVIGRMTGEGAPELVERVREALRDRPGPDYSWPGNVRELEQAVRRILLTRAYGGDGCREASGLAERLHRGLENGNLQARHLLQGYCALLYGRLGSYEAVARRTGLDRRTVRKYVAASESCL